MIDISREENCPSSSWCASEHYYSIWYHCFDFLIWMVAEALWSSGVWKYLTAEKCTMKEWQGIETRKDFNILHILEIM